MIVSEICKALGKTQTQVARHAGMKQPSLAKLKSQSNMLISTLRKEMKAMGGGLGVAVRSPQGRVY
jgi:DNA-binding phage protein